MAMITKIKADQKTYSTCNTVMDFPNTLLQQYFTMLRLECISCNPLIASKSFEFR